MLKGRGPENSERVFELLYNCSIFTHLTLSKLFLSFNFVVLVLVPLTLTPASIYAQTPPRVNLNSTLIMTSSSMSPNLRQNDGIVVGHVPFNSLKIGDIIVFKTHGTDASGNHATIVHRVAQIITENGQRIIRAKGDANHDSNPGVDFPIFQRNYIGKVVYVIPQLGAVSNFTNSGGGGNTVQSRPIVIVPKIMQNLLKVISFSTSQSSLRTPSQSTSQSSSLIDKYFLLLISVSLIPAIIVIIYGIVLIGMYLFGTINTPSGKSAYLQGNVSYLLLLFICFVPIGAVLFLVKKLHRGTSRDKT